ncbi:MAG: hypothetical protein LLF98_02040 [Clostridium sp.]|uniref:hypothetical protein n=1 Tax=Clostridium sp. TaxID=1506 RepID=UPI0025C6B38F|nr:hypothetical protein [Clostridium sp.]MCE5220062.1 hypothetical protein [Clostridium sp.]
MGNLETKVCKICGEEKQITEFNSKGSGHYDSICNVCNWFKRHNNINIKDGWFIGEYKQIIHYILIDKLLLNEIANNLNRDLFDLCDVVVNYLKLRGQNKTQLKYNCDYCNTEFLMHPYQLLSQKAHCCSKQCSNSYKKGINYHKIIGKKNCIYCGNEFDVYDNVPDQKYCCLECKDKHYKENPKQEEVICSNCGKSYTRRKQSRYNNTFCSLECELEFKHKEKWEIRQCEICGKDFECLKSSTQKMCSIQCQGIWQSLYLSGENANGYNHNISKEDRTLICQWCGTLFEVSPHKINTAKFCSDKCRQDYYSNVLSQSPEWKERSRKNAVKNLENKVWDTNTYIQVLINNLLDELKIKYINEKGFTYFAVDNYLEDYNLIIEVMGTYWHCDHRIYKNINYDMQVKRIKMDKIKHTYLLNNYNIEILYLWEKDIVNNPQLCKNLILNYINNNGILDNYHSFNYVFNKQLKVSNKIEIPYMDWDINNLKEIIDISVKEKMSHKQQDKWITYNCEYCGNEKEMLISRYNKQNHHYCSKECAIKGRVTKIKVKCNNCNEEIEVPKSKYNKNIRFFCNQQCQHEYQRQFGFKSDHRDLNYNIVQI